MSRTVELNDKKLKDLIKALKGKVPKARVGILGGAKNSRKDDTQTNAEIGAKHEFGDDQVPQRSFLRVPLSDNLQKYLEKNGAFNKDVFEKVLKEKSIYEWVKKLAITAEQIIAEGFASGGYGKWKPSNMEHKKVHQTLVETQQLRNSITSDVK